jgi:hypothetical protein
MITIEYIDVLILAWALLIFYLTCIYTEQFLAPPKRTGSATGSNATTS